MTRFTVAGAMILAAGLVVGCTKDKQAPVPPDSVVQTPTTAAANGSWFDRYMANAKSREEKGEYPKALEFAESAKRMAHTDQDRAKADGLIAEINQKMKK